MIRHYFWAFSFLCFSGFILCQGLAAAEPLPAKAAAPLCLYEGRSYSDGAYICVQKSLMLNCTADVARATWKIVADKDLSERCVTPTTLGTAPALRRHARRTHVVRRRAEPAQQASAKCFSFNNKQYCE